MLPHYFVKQGHASYPIYILIMLDENKKHNLFVKNLVNISIIHIFDVFDSIE